MPVKVKKIGSKYCVVDSSGTVKKGRCHASKKQAIAQTQAINISMMRQQGKKIQRKK